MNRLFIGVVAASVFGIIATITLGQEALLDAPWVDVVFWSLIGAGAALAAIDMTWECLPCRVAGRSHRQSLLGRLCERLHCAH